MYLDDLNPPQKQAVLEYQGPVLVLAGAGSGKTRVITYRIAYLLQEKLARPWEILAVTFTNKAAGEMRERVRTLLGSDTGDLYLGTFHAFGARLLRRYAEIFQRTSRFTIYDDDDQHRLIRTLLKQALPETQRKEYTQALRKFISQVKGHLRAPDQIPLAPSLSKDLMLDLYYKYETALQNNNAFDFDDLIRLPGELYRQHPAILAEHRQRYRFLLIDEFQDTNLPQGDLARLLAAPDGNITAVGDDDQSIYGWRGAWIGNILQFEREYRKVRTFRLEQNYRSTQAILDLAHQVIKQNQTRHVKKLWTSRKGGIKPLVLAAGDDQEEAAQVVSHLQSLTSQEKFHYKDVAILYRTNAQSRALEEALRKAVIPYIIIGGLKFYERKEVKDLLAYLRLLVNPNDLISLQRIINLPPRGIGEKTWQRLIAFATEQKLPLFKAMIQAENCDDLKNAAGQRLMNFAQWIAGLQQFAANHSLFELGEKLLHESGLLAYYEKDEALEFENRRDNLHELLNALREFSFESDRTGLDDLDLFLQDVALVTDLDRWNPQQQAVTLMTLHAAKGLEFPIVFITGLEDGLFPLAHARDFNEDVEEERRLFYVGATRAKDRLFLTYANNRLRWGQAHTWQKPSRFLSEIPRQYLDYSEISKRSYKSDGEEDLFRETKIPRRPHPRFDPPTRDDTEYPLGSRVKHFKFGEGVILQSEGAGKGMRLLVNFEDGGEKLLLAEFAKLERIF